MSGVLTAERVMARRKDVAVKIDAELARMAKIVASFKDVSLAEYLSETLKPIVEADLREHSRRALDDPSVKPKGKDSKPK